MSSEEIIKGYDPRIVRRLITYLKPEIRLFLFAVCALIIATISDLLLPVMLKRVVDERIVVSYRRISLDSAESEDLDPLDLSSSPVIGGWVYLLSGELGVLDLEVQEALMESGVLDSESFYLFPSDREEIRGVTSLKSGLFDLDDEYGAIRLFDLDRLSRSERAILRYEDIRGVINTATIVFLLLITVLGFSFLQVYLMARVGQNVMKRLRLEIFTHTLSLRLAYLQHHPVGGLVTRATNDVETLSELFTNVAISLLKDLFIIVGVIVTMILLESRLALIAFLTVPPVVIATGFFRARARAAFRRVRHWVSEVNSFLSEHISGMQVVQLFAAERRSMKRFEERSNSLLIAGLFEVRVFAIFRPLVDLFTSLSIGVVLYYGAGLNLKGSVSLGVLIAFINLIGRFYQPIQDISEKFTVLQSAMAGGERVFDLLDTDDAVPDTGTHKFESSAAGRSIEFDGVGFGYYPEEPVIRDLSFKIDEGERIAVVGYTGAGKTTIGNLMTRLWDIQSGSIRVNGIDIRSVPLADLRSRIQPVQQDVFLFSGTVAENIRLGRELSTEELIKAAEAVNARDFIERLPHGFETMIEESGANLSTGERQLISFARVLAGKPDVIILDEATSSIDTETERLIQDALEVLLEGRTSIVIAHRLSTIRHADRIFVLSDGRLVESGSHDTLIDQNGAYATLYRLQYSEGGGQQNLEE